MNLRNTIRSLLRWARVTRVGDDTADFPVQQVGYLAKIGDSVMWFPYGMHANVPVDELCLMVSMQGNPEARVSIPGSPQKRVKPLAASEVVFFHPDTKSKLHFKANGDIEIVGFSGAKQVFKANGDIEITSALGGNINITSAGDTTITVAGDAVITSVGKTTITGGGTLKLDGITAVDIVAALIEASDGGSVTSLCNEAFLLWANTHIHSTPSSGNTFAPTIAAVVGTETTTVLKAE